MITDPTLDDLLNDLGIEKTTEDTPPDTEITEDSNATSETEPKTDPAPEKDPPPTPEVLPQENTKAQQAFIHMRQQNKQLSDMLKSVSALVGVEGNLTDEKLLSALQEKIVADKAQKQNVPVELLQRLQTLEERDQEYTAFQQRQSMAMGFQQVQQQFGLDQAQLNAFAAELVANDMNPMTQKVDMVKEYKALHFEELLRKKTEEAVAAEQARAAKASSTSTTPGNRTTTPGTPDGKIESVRQLEDWLNANTK